MKNIALLTLISILFFGCKEKEMQTLNSRTGIYMASENSPSVNFNIWLNVGSQNDPEGKEGLAYITAQMVAQGSTENNSYSDILNKLYPIASSYGIKVDKEMTSFRAITHPDNLEKFYPLMTDALLKPAFKEEDFNRIVQNTIQSIEKTLRYSSDEELAKAALMQEIFKDTPYEHLTMGSVQSLNSITIEDVKNFYNEYYVGDFNIGLAGSFDESLPNRMHSDLLGTEFDEEGNAKPEKIAEGSHIMKGDNQPPINTKKIEGLNFYLIEKDAISTPISFGFPIDLTRGDEDYYALDLFRSWFGEHRNQSSHLYQVIREARGINYGDYAYIEAFLNGGSLRMPDPNNPRREQIFQVWIRSVPHEVRHFSLRAAMRELKMVVDSGMSKENFESTKQFLYKYALHYAPTLADRLGYQIDSEFYGVEDNGEFIKHYRNKIKNLTLEQVNAAIKKYIQYDNVLVAAVTKDAEKFKKNLIEDNPSPIKEWYSSEKSDEIYEEDELIATFPLEVKAENVTIVPVDEMFEK